MTKSVVLVFLDLYSLAKGVGTFEMLPDSVQRGCLGSCSVSL